MIIVWKNDGNPKYAGKELELFRISWSDLRGRWVRNPEGTHWGVKHPAQECNTPLTRGVEHYGVVKDHPGVDVSVPKVELGRPILGVFDGKESEEE